ncbi:MAG: YidB family protein [Xanthomonadales bacterium]|jgi:uncharacterized protein YidB (DUF937 family)|nr:YidB family protein [Xanthomonadales bacterium]
MFDVLLKDLAQRFGLGDQARPLLGLLLALIFDPRRGGFPGFVDQLRQGGAGDQSVSWIGRGENRPISSAQVEQALGLELLDWLSAKLNLQRGTLTTALTAMLPGVIDKLTPDGITPSAAAPTFAESYLRPYVDEVGNAPLPRLPTASVPPVAAAGPATRLRWPWIAAAAALLLGAAGWWFWPVDATPQPATPPALPAPIPAEPAPATDAADPGNADARTSTASPDNPMELPRTASPVEERVIEYLNLELGLDAATMLKPGELTALGEHVIDGRTTQWWRFRCADGSDCYVYARTVGSTWEYLRSSTPPPAP